MIINNVGFVCIHACVIKGLYIAGGLTPKNIDLLRHPEGPFMTAFRDKGRVSGILSTVPVYAVMVEDVGQRGAYRVAYRQFYDVTTHQKEGPLSKKKLCKWLHQLTSSAIILYSWLVY